MWGIPENKILIMGSTWLQHSEQRKGNPVLQIQKRMRGVRENIRMRRQSKTIIELLNFEQIIFE